MSLFAANIKKFNAMYRLPVADRPSLEQLGVPALIRLQSFKDILLEEINEIDPILAKLRAINDGVTYQPETPDGGIPPDPYHPTALEVLTDLADLLGDIPVYCASEMAKFGLPLDDVLTIIMDSNFSKMGVDGLPIYDGRGKLQKGPGYWKPEPSIKVMLSQAVNEAVKQEEQTIKPEEVGSLAAVIDPLDALLSPTGADGRYVNQDDSGLTD